MGVLVGLTSGVCFYSGACLCTWAVFIVLEFREMKKRTEQGAGQ